MCVRCSRRPLGPQPAAQDKTGHVMTQNGRKCGEAATKVNGHQLGVATDTTATDPILWRVLSMSYTGMLYNCHTPEAFTLRSLPNQAYFASQKRQALHSTSITHCISWQAKSSFRYPSYWGTNPSRSAAPCKGKLQLGAITPTPAASPPPPPLPPAQQTQAPTPTRRHQRLHAGSGRARVLVPAEWPLPF